MKRLSILLLAVVLSACSGKIPDSYRGIFVDTSKGARITLKANSGVFVSPDGRTLTQEVWDYEPDEEFNKLMTGKSALLVQQNKKNPRFLDVFWIAPKSSHYTEGGFVWFEDVEILNTRFDLTYEDRDEKAQRFKLVHSLKGQLLLDATTQRVQKGWGKDRVEYEMRRVSND